MWNDSPLDNGFQEDAADAYDAALALAWQGLYEQAPEGVGWEVVSDEQDRDARFIFEFRDGGGYEFTAIINIWE